MVLSRAYMYLYACALTTIAQAVTSHSEEVTWTDINVPVGSDFTLNGTENSIPYSKQWRDMTWALPDLTLMPRGSSAEFPTPDGTVTMQVSDNGELLHVQNIQKAYFGLYYCLILDNNVTFHVTRRGVNMEYHYADDVIKRYQRYLLITGITAGLLAAVAIIAIVLTVWRHHRDKNEEDDGEDTTEIVKKEQTPAYHNPTVRARTRANNTDKALKPSRQQEQQTGTGKTGSDGQVV